MEEDRCVKVSLNPKLYLVKDHVDSEKQLIPSTTTKVRTLEFKFEAHEA
jgi:hypothetical protein